jgi:hypothetical protein
MRVNERGSVVPVEGHALTPLPNIPGKDYISEGGAFDRAGRFVMLGSMHPFDDDLSGNYQNLIARLLDA